MHSAIGLRWLLVRRCRALVSGTARAASTAAPSGRRRLPADGPGLAEFVAGSAAPAAPPPEGAELPVPLGATELEHGLGRRVLFVVHGCQMNVNDTEVAWAVLQQAGYQRAENISEADVVFIMTCSIREGAETKIWNKLENYKRLKASKGYTGSQFKVGVLGCMAERLRQRLVEADVGVDLVAGPDSYRHLPRLLAQPEDAGAAVHVQLSLEETYADVQPVRLDPHAPAAYVTIMRGCDNMCTYCIVPFTRGRERSRPLDSVVEEVRRLSEQGVREVTLLGQNVNSYRDMSGSRNSAKATRLAAGFSTVYRPKTGGTRFADLLSAVADVDPEMRVRFTSPHPKDFPDEVLRVIAERPNVCSCLHLPAQSGSSRVLADMRRGYTREAYLELVRHVRRMVPGVALTSDFIAGFCGETEADFEETLSLMREVGYQYCFLFAYSRREKTRAHHRLVDDVPPAEKQRRVAEMARLYRAMAQQLNTRQVGSTQLVLLERPSPRSPDSLLGRNDANVKVIVPRRWAGAPLAAGQYVAVEVTGASSEVLHGRPLERTTLQEFARQHDPPSAPNELLGDDPEASQCVV
ncbi:mitochondrial tRNA methylthiotransferase CDK5RAP1-like [Amphibalanus amphitrite]|uniref:mitochondrial tRNA methylthiotransferase CDK5RAP1-like n=1 Tax=Amphibalanus amphitrite TaxID=1232801 RepID=UPI001C920936|nr:mitochondrial tRNA methylthiotransferase CDK5RAP1-like [Amphibalanus amphitrite]XP_043219239.1 mitochondrial tRNA methylthiotransferase CDK5RAP1-like [Amphibalanus amphitrite]